MSRKLEKQLIVGLDVGTSKVSAIVGEVGSQGDLEIIGFGSHPSRGLKRGVVVNIESTVQSIQRAIEEAELMAGCQINAVWVGIAGSHVENKVSNGVANIKEREVSQDDVDRVMDSARAIALPDGQRILHVQPQEYVIDGQDGIREPIGMSGVRLEAKVHIVTGALSAVNNIMKCVERCGLHVEGIILEQAASASAVLSDDERELGVALVDIGGGTTDIAVYVDGALRHSSVVGIAGDQVSNDIAVILRTPAHAAEQIKINHACILRGEGGDEAIEVPSVGERPPRRITRRSLSEIVEPRMDEILVHARDILRRSGYEELIRAGVVLTGGSARMNGLVDLAEEIFQMPVRLGVPQRATGLREIVQNPQHATGVGLLLHGIEQMTRGNVTGRGTEISALPLWDQMRRWFKGNF
ncbi:MAG: cell division protein FtsA [Halothiobacillaceae bacterium]|nr:cell division protein FtsA [Halothiobacillaceae bacterium]MDY0049791.1 cell division protein FtsA [Halothiobacillaceae bacterium]